ncbi:MAG: DNA polymerase III subunit delta [Pseudomonadota bacterium]
MKITYPQFEQQINKNLAPLYLIHSDELLLVKEAVDLLRCAARKAGFDERISLSIDSGTDWGKLLHTEIYARSLFANKRLIELHLADTKPNPAANKILKEISAQFPADTLLLITANKLDSKTEQTTWYKALDKIGVTLPIWPIATAQLPGWIMQRAKKAGLTMTADAASLLALQIEGNLLAAAQEIEKLLLLDTGTVIDVDTITSAVTDSARFDIFNLVDSALLGDGERSLRILQHLQGEAAEPVLVLWALARELRTLAELQKQLQKGTALATLFSKYRIWEKRQPNVRHFLQKHPLPQCRDMLSDCSRIDRIIKGATPGNTWDALQQLTLKMSGNDIIKN